jgi:hypothetical protein
VDLPPGLLWELTEGTDGEPPAAVPGYGVTVLHATWMFREGYRHGLAARYVAETGLSAAAAYAVAQLEGADQRGPQGGALDLTRLTDGEQALFARANATLWACRALLMDLGGGHSPVLQRTVDGVSVTLTADDAAAAQRVLWDAYGTRETGGRSGPLTFGTSIADGPHTALPSAEPAVATFRQLSAKARLSDAQARERLDAHLTRADGGRAPSVREWLATNGAVAFFQEVAHALSALEREDTTRRLAAAEERIAELEAGRRRPGLRQGTAVLRAMMQRADHIANARKRGQLANRFTQEEADARRLFKYQPLGWAERLVVHALAAMARDQGLLETHPWALQRRPRADSPAPRVALEFPGLAELARVAGYEPDAEGRVPKETRRTVERALRNLLLVPRWIAEPVLVQVRQKGERPRLVEDVRVTQTLWVEADTTVITKQTRLLLHPVAFASHLASYVPVGNLAARYDAAKRAIGCRQMRDEWAIFDDYLRLIAGGKAGDLRRRHAADPTTVGEQTLPFAIYDAKLREVLGITHLARDRGETEAKRRVSETLAFVQAMGTVHHATLEEGEKGPLWRMQLAHPDVHVTGMDPAQGVLALAGESFDDEEAL